MADVEIRGGVRFQTATPDEVRGIVREVQAEASAWQREMLRGVKYMRLPVLTGTIANSALSIGGHSAADIIGPEMGDVWVLRHLWVSGLATGASPDVLNVRINNQTWWQLNGNNFSYTFGKGEFVILQGEALAFVNSGALAATGQVSIGGAYWRVPGEKLAELY